MMITLIFKDMLLIGRKGLILLGIILIFPVYMNSQMEMNAQWLVCFLVSAFVMLMFITQVASEEDKSKGSEYLIIANYPKYTIVAAKYLGAMFLYVLCMLIFFSLSYAVPSVMTRPDALVTAISFAGVSLYINIMFPILFRFGVKLMSIIFTLAVIVLPYLFVILVKHTDIIERAVRWYTGFVSASNTVVLAVGLTAVVLIMTFVSYLISLQIFTKKDLC